MRLPIHALSHLSPQNGCYFGRRQFKSIFLNDRISIRISLKFILKSLIDIKSALVQVMACRLLGALYVYLPVLPMVVMQRTYILLPVYVLKTRPSYFIHHWTS